MRPSSPQVETIFSILAIIIAVGCIGIAPAHAYLDPGSGSFFIQMIIGVVVGSLFAVRIFFKRITGFFSGVVARWRGSRKKQ